MKRILVILVVLGAVALSIPQAYAACGNSAILQHILGSHFICDASRGPITFYAYELEDPTANLGALVSPAPTTVVGIEPGTTLQQVQVATDWANAGVNGCPVNATGFPSSQTHRIMVLIQDNKGNGITMTLSGADPTYSGYAIETAHKFNPNAPDGSFSDPISCAPGNGRPAVISTTPSSVSVKFAKPPLIYSDCDPDSTGVQGFGDTCPDNFNASAATALGRIYTSVQPCGTFPDINRLNTLLPWTLNAATIAADGTATLSNITRPLAPNCLFVGNTLNVTYPNQTTGPESGAIVGYVEVQSANAAPTKITNLTVTKSQGKATVEFRTDQQVGLGGLKVFIAGAKGLTEIGRIAPTGGDQGSSYKASYSMNEIKGSKTITVKAYDGTGREISSAQASF